FVSPARRVSRRLPHPQLFDFLGDVGLPTRSGARVGEVVRPDRGGLVRRAGAERNPRRPRARINRGVDGRGGSARDRIRTPGPARKKIMSRTLLGAWDKTVRRFGGTRAVVQA